MVNELQQIYTLLSALSVSGDAVDVVAEIRLKLRKLIKEADDGK